MRSCDACAQSLDDLDQFCRHCGQARVMVFELDLDAEGDFAFASQVAQDHKSGQSLDASDRLNPERAGIRRYGAPALGVVVVCVAAAMLFAVSGFGRSDSTAEEPTRSEATTDATPGDSAPESANTALIGSLDPPGNLTLADAAELQRFFGSGLDPAVLAILSGPDDLAILDLSTGERTQWVAPEPLRDEQPLALLDRVVVVGESRAWARPFDASEGWLDLGPADRVALSTKPDRIWMRSINEKARPSDAEFLWNEVDATGAVHRTMFRNREIYFPTPELVAGIGGDLFRLTDAAFNAWRLFSPYGVLIAVGDNDLVVKECNTQLVCERAWYDTRTGEARDSVYPDLAERLETSYGARLSPDGRFVYQEGPAGGVLIQSVADRSVILNHCRWEVPVVWSPSSDAFVCIVDDASHLYKTQGADSTGANQAVVVHAQPTSPETAVQPDQRFDAARSVFVGTPTT